MNSESSTLNVRHMLLDEALNKGIQQNEEHCKVWASYKKGHEKVVDALESFRKDLYVNCMIPIGKRALMKGRLIHTNEVLASLGNGYFAKYSTEGAKALCERRIKKAEEMLKNLSGERDLLESRMILSESNLFEECAGGEIVECWNEDQVAQWKKKHREREKEYHKKLANIRQEERKQIETEEDLINRLDQLEIEEELADELNRLEDEQYELFGDELEEGECYCESENSLESEEDDSIEKQESITSFNADEEEIIAQTYKRKKSVSFAETNEIFIRKETYFLKNEELKDSGEESKDAGDDIVRIQFSHSETNPVTNTDENSIVTPADIYRIFSKPKSILKKTKNEHVIVSQYDIEEVDEDEEDEEDTIKPSAYETVIKDIRERNTMTDESPENEEEKKETRPVSKFKRDRQLRR